MVNVIVGNTLRGDTEKSQRLYQVQPLVKNTKSRSLFLSSPNVIHHPPTPCVIRAWWVSPTREEADLESPLELGDRCWPVGCEPGPVHWRFTLARPVWVYPGDVHFFQDHCHHIILHPIALQRSERAERTLIQQKQTNKTNMEDKACRHARAPLWANVTTLTSTRAAKYSRRKIIRETVDNMTCD